MIRRVMSVEPNFTVGNTGGASADASLVSASAPPKPAADCRNLRREAALSSGMNDLFQSFYSDSKQTGPWSQSGGMCHPAPASALKSLRGKPNRYFRWGAKGISIGRIPTYRSTLNHGPDAFASRSTARNQPDCQLRFDAGRHVERTRPAGGGSDRK